MSNLKAQVSRFREELEAHKKRLRRFNPDSVVMKACLKYRWTGTDIQRMRHYPHNELYYLLKLSIKLAARPYTPYEDCSDRDFDRLINTLKGMPWPQLKIALAEGDPLEMVLKWLAQFCQLPYQEEIDRTSIARSIFLYELEGCPINIAEVFERETGVPIRSFFQGCFAVWAITAQQLGIPDRVPGSNLSVFKSPLWERFIPLIRTTYSEFSDLCDRSDLTSDLYEMFSGPVLIKSPVLKLACGANVVPWPMFLLHRLCYGPYSILKERIGTGFTDAFGLAFQSYVHRILRVLEQHTGDHFHGESASPCSGEKPDYFSLYETQSTILCIEVKANEDVLVLSQERLLNSARPILGKAINQCHELWIRAKNGKEPEIPIGLEQCIPLIVTFRPFHFANGAFYRKNILPLKGPNIADSLQPLLDTYQVIDIRDFEYLAKICICSNKPLLEIITDKIHTAKFDDWSSYLTKQAKALHELDKWTNDLPEITNVIDKLVIELEQSLVDVEGVALN